VGRCTSRLPVFIKLKLLSLLLFNWNSSYDAHHHCRTGTDAQSHICIWIYVDSRFLNDGFWFGLRFPISVSGNEGVGYRFWFFWTVFKIDFEIGFGRYSRVFRHCSKINIWCYCWPSTFRFSLARVYNIILTGLYLNQRGIRINSIEEARGNSVYALNIFSNRFWWILKFIQENISLMLYSIFNYWIQKSPLVRIWNKIVVLHNIWTWTFGKRILLWLTNSNNF